MKCAFLHNVLKLLNGLQNCATVHAASESNTQLSTFEVATTASNSDAFARLWCVVLLPLLPVFAGVNDRSSVERACIVLATCVKIVLLFYF